MPWIQIIDEDEATGALKAIYDDLTQRRGKMSNIMRMHSPEASYQRVSEGPINDAPIRGRTRWRPGRG